MKVAITGVAGFIGSNLAVELLKNNFNVIGIDNLSYGVIDQVPKNVAFFKEDIRDKNIKSLFKGVDFVFHLAAKNSIIDCEKNPQETNDINIEGTKNIFNLCLENNVKKVIYAESSAVYEGSKNLPSVESEIMPKSTYALSKIENHKIAKEYNAKFGLNTTGLRYFNVYGPRQDYRRTIPPVFSAFIINFLKNKQPVIYGDGSKKRDFIYVDDVNFFHSLCMTNKSTDGEVFNIGSGNNYSVKYIFDLIKKMLKSNLNPIYKDNFDFEAQNNLANIDKAKSIGWQPNVSIEEGLKKSIDYIQANVIKGEIK
tara:strand:- start:530 stop:1462 length:933 start_codon:yes stop_codon:yes gene_type:complete